MLTLRGFSLIWLATFLLTGLWPSAVFPATDSPLVFLHCWAETSGRKTPEVHQIIRTIIPNAKIQTPGLPAGTCLESLLSSHSPPDLLTSWAGARIQCLVNKTAITPIDTLWAKTDLDKAFPPSISEACTVKGHKYALPVAMHPVVFFYNKRILAQHGIMPPTTWKQFIAACDQLKSAGIPPFALGSKAGWPAQFWFDALLLRTAGPKYRQALMENRASYRDPQVKKVFTIWKSLLDAKYFNTSPDALDWEEAARLVHDGKAAMTLSESRIITIFEKKLNWRQGTDFDFFPFPIMDESIARIPFGPLDVIAVASKARREKALEALIHFAAPGPQMALSRSAGALSPSRLIPLTFYSPMQRRLLHAIRVAPHWAFNYDLATPPEMARLGLAAFADFIKNPMTINSILNALADRIHEQIHTIR
ncbi:ABC transporter substrate-binding protein [Pseudodesulfovibrio piezophilus]|uniref:Extracellular solute-binding protein family 1 n=1 Tax=Pseudodesulfovibrio piezophilus (strain DSM 21447 / JCM 15486 / C1TLV30) TaxID=1322246 RepID=M1WSF0_PSEP2|nr:ABC transporter substrate-binding protein [Pseudodesulfovibrio piezophilus]CCH48852.1 protein of unknown function [Pseudodesulfovibrio piezophilus C1TLV30]